MKSTSNNDNSDSTYPNPAIARAMSRVQTAISKVQADPTRPVYHFLAPARRMNDVNGFIFYKGYYHLFYQLNPHTHWHWGHARSRDLVHWEHLPIVLCPAEEQGEENCASGCTVINDLGQPLTFYTSMKIREDARYFAEQWAAIGDDDLITWKRHPANPILTEDMHGDLKIYDWRDPFIFREGPHFYLVLGGNLNDRKGGEAIVALYRGENSELTRWKFLGILFKNHDENIVNHECPNFFPLGNKWLLVVSPHGRMRYYIGNFNKQTFTFESESQGYLNWGPYRRSGFSYYGTNCLLDNKGRWIMSGCVHGFESNRGWEGCMNLPQILTLNADGYLEQEPIPELQALRAKHYTRANIKLTDSSYLVKEIRGDTLEILVKFEPSDANSFGLKVRCSDDGKKAVRIAYDGERIDVADTTGPFRLLSGEKLKLHIFLDKSLMEVYVNSRIYFTKVIYPEKEDLGLELFAMGGSITISSLDVWKMKSIW